MCEWRWCGSPKIVMKQILSYFYARSSSQCEICSLWLCCRRKLIQIEITIAYCFPFRELFIACVTRPGVSYFPAGIIGKFTHFNLSYPVNVTLIHISQSTESSHHPCMPSTFQSLIINGNYQIRFIVLLNLSLYMDA